MCLSQEPVNIRNQHKTGASTMSKNECKRCSECKHYERVNDNEMEDHGNCTLYPTWVDVWAVGWGIYQERNTRARYRLEPGARGLRLGGAG